MHPALAYSPSRPRAVKRESDQTVDDAVARQLHAALHVLERPRRRPRTSAFEDDMGLDNQDLEEFAGLNASKQYERLIELDNSPRSSLHFATPHTLKTRKGKIGTLASLHP